VFMQTQLLIQRRDPLLARLAEQPLTVNAYLPNFPTGVVIGSW